MQHWICAYCGELYLDPVGLTDHIFECHKREMAIPESRGRLFATALRMALGDPEEEPAGGSRGGGTCSDGQ